MKLHIKKNDTAVVLGGKDAGKQAKVLSVNSKDRTAKLEGLNLHKKHTKQNPQMKVTGGIIEQEAPIPLSRLAPWCPACKKPARVGRKITDKGSLRICRKCEKTLA